MTAILLWILRWGTGQDWIPAAELAARDLQIARLQREIDDLHYAVDVAQASRDWQIELSEISREFNQ